MWALRAQLYCVNGGAQLKEVGLVSTSALAKGFCIVMYMDESVLRLAINKDKER